MLEVVVDALYLKGSAHQVAAICGRDLMNLKGMIIAVGQLQLDRLTALSAGVDRLGREQGVTLRCCGFLNGYGSIQRQTVKIGFAVAVCGFRARHCFTAIGIANLESAALQRCSIFICFQNFKVSLIFRGSRTERQLIAGQLNRRLNQNNRLNTGTVSRCDINIVTVNIHAG